VLGCEQTDSDVEEVGTRSRLAGRIFRSGASSCLASCFFDGRAQLCCCAPCRAGDRAAAARLATIVD
jgi:hypothetical protein